MAATLERVHQEIHTHLLQVRDLFLPDAKLTLLVRDPRHPDGSRNLVVTSDELPAAIAALGQRLAPATPNCTATALPPTAQPPADGPGAVSADTIITSENEA